MKSGFVSSGLWRFRRSKEFALWKTIQSEYAEKLESASALEKVQMKLQMRREFLRRRKEGHEPSPGTLW